MVTLSAPAAAGGARVRLASSLPGIAWIESETVVVPEGKTAASFPISTSSDMTGPQRVTITGSLNGTARDVLVVGEKARESVSLSLVLDPTSVVRASPASSK